MLYELRTYTVKPGSLGDMVKAAATVATEIRKNDYGKLEGYWSTEIGALNQVLHLWSYSDYAERARVRGELANNPRWVGEYMPLIRPLIVRQDIRLLNAVRAPAAPAAALPAREKYSKIVGLWQTEAGQPNEVCHVWAYKDLNARAEARAAALKDPVWQEFLGKGSALLDEMHSTIMLPAPHSPLK